MSYAAPRGASGLGESMAARVSSDRPKLTSTAWVSRPES